MKEKSESGKTYVTRVMPKRIDAGRILIRVLGLGKVSGAFGKFYEPRDKNYLTPLLYFHHIG